MRCFLVKKDAAGKVTRGISEASRDDLPPGDVLVRVQYSSLNYKDALAASGHPGVARRFPHVPGIDAAGVIEEVNPTAAGSNLKAGDEVLITGYELGAPRWGGWSEFVRVPHDWVVPLPAGLSALDAMTLGTAGFTAAQCVDALQHHGITPERGPVVVTGSTGGVGILAVMLLAKLKYNVAAVTGKADRADWLRNLGASEILDRQAVNDTSGQPLLPSRWAGAVDTVGGNTLATLLRSLTHRGCVAACGLVGGAELPLTVYPFILRGAALFGIDSAQCPREPRERIWRLLSGEWKLPKLDAIRTVVPLADVEAQIQAMLAGGAFGRVVVAI